MTIRKFGHISLWNIFNITSLKNMFKNAKKFNKNMSHIFNDAKLLINH